MSDPAAHVDLLRQLTADLRAGWKAGRARPLEAYLAEHPELAADEPSACELIYREFCVRNELGQKPQASDYVRRFPQWAPRLVEMFVQHASGSASHLEETQMLGAATTFPRETIVRPYDSPPSPSAPSHDGASDPTVAWSGGVGRPAGPILRRFGDYELIEEIARGGMGVVYKARQVKLNRIVAVKMILAGQLASEELVRRFYSEAEAAANLDHPGIVPIYEVNQHEGQHYFSMGYVDGASLSARVARRPLAAREAAALLKQIAEAVHYAHQHGVIHRDLKPQNVLLTMDGQPKVTDFGLAKTVQSDSDLTTSGQVLGTPSYMPPEQASGKLLELGPRSDVYSLGAILYCLLTGRPPFHAANMIETLKQVIEREPAAPRQLNPAVDADLETICLKCLQKEPHQRFATAQELVEELQRFLQGEPIRSRRIGTLQRAARWCRRKPLAAALVASVLLLVVVLPATVVVARHASRSRQVSSLQGRFEAGLDRPELTAAYIQQMQSLVDDLTLLESAQAEDRRQRLTERFAETIQSALQAPKLDADESVRIDAAVELLRDRDAVRAETLKKSLTSRLAAWQSEFDLRPPFANAADVFTRDAAQLVDGKLLPKAVKPDAPRDSLVVASQASSAGSVRFEAVFDEAWADAAEVGVRLGDEKTRYDFRLRIPRGASREDQEETAPSPQSFRAARQFNAAAIMEILRNGQPVQRKSLSAGELPAGSLEIWVQRTREELTLRVGPSLSLNFSDPFPLPTNLGSFALVWPEQAPLESLRGLRQLRAETASALERADQLFDAGQYRDALLLYSDPVINAADSAYRLEARYKQGLCHSELRQLDEAAAVFEPLMIEEGQRWPALAGCRLWLMRLAQGRGSDADAIHEHLAGRYQSVQLGALIPSDLREPILHNYQMQFKTLSRVLKYDPQRVNNMERAVAIDRLLSFDGQSTPDVLLALADVYEYLGQPERALEITSELVRRDRRGFTLRRHFRLLRMNGRAAEVPLLVDQALRQDYAKAPGSWPALIIERARAQAALDNWEQAETDIDRVLAMDQEAEARQQRPIDHVSASDAYLMKGFLLRRRGQQQAAEAIWRRAWEKFHGAAGNLSTLTSTTINVLIFGSFTGELTETDAVRMVQSAVRAADTPLLVAANSMLTPQSTASALRQMWRSPRGVQLAEATAWQTASRSDRVRIPLVLAATEYFLQNALGSSFSREQEELVWSTISDAAAGVLDTGQISSAQVIQLGLAWKGTLSLLGWAGVAPTLAPDLRVRAAYVLAHRNLRLGNRPQAESLLRQALKESPPDSSLARLCQEDLKLLQSQQSRLIVRSESDAPTTVRVLQGGREVAVVETTVDLPPGEFELQLAEENSETSLTPSHIKLSAVGRQEVLIQSRWRAAPAASDWPGLVPRPTLLDGIGRWQIASRELRGGRFVHAISADGAVSALVSSDGVIRLYEAQSEQLLKVLVGHTFFPHVLEFSPDGQWLASASNDRTLRVWRVSTGAISLLLPVRAPRSLAWSADSRLLASGGYDRKTRVYDLTGAQVVAWDADAAVLGFAADGKHLAALQSDRTIRLWPLADQAPPVTLPPRDVRLFAFSPDGRWLAACLGDHSLRLWDTAAWSEQPAWQVQRPNVRRLTFSRDGTALSVGTDDGYVAAHSLSDGAPRWLSAKGGATILALAERGEGNWLAADWGTVKEFHADGTPGALVRWPRNRLMGLAFDPARQRLIVETQSDKHPHVWNWEGQPQLAATQAGPHFSTASFSPDGAQVLCVGADSKARLWDIATGAVLHALQEHRGGVTAQASAFSPDGTSMAIGGAEKLLNVWDSSGTLRWSKADLPDGVWSVAFSADGRRLLVGLADRDKGIHAFAAESGQPLDVLRGHSAGIRDLAFSPDGRWLASASNDSTVRLWNSDGTAGPILKAHTASINSIAWHPDSQSLVSASTDGTCRVWRADGSLIHTLIGPASEVFHVSYNHDGSEVLAATDDGAVRFWDTAAGQPQRTLLLLGGSEAALVDRFGRRLSGTQDAEQELIYMVETPDRASQVLSSAEFSRFAAERPLSR